MGSLHSKSLYWGTLWCINVIFVSGRKEILSYNWWKNDTLDDFQSLFGPLNHVSKTLTEIFSGLYESKS